MRRQLLSPKPSASASVIVLVPHHSGAPATSLVVPVTLADVLVLPEPQAATPADSPIATSIAAHLRCICTPLSGDSRATLPRPFAESSPRDAVDGDAGGE